MQDQAVPPPGPPSRGDPYTAVCQHRRVARNLSWHGGLLGSRARVAARSRVEGVVYYGWDHGDCNCTQSLAASDRKHDRWICARELGTYAMVVSYMDLRVVFYTMKMSSYSDLSMTAPQPFIRVACC